MIAMGSRWYFITLTDRRVIFQKVSMASGKPAGLAWTDPRGSVSIGDAALDGAVWSKAIYERPDAKPLRLNIQRVWRDEGQQFVAQLAGGGSARPGEGSTSSA